MGKNGFTVYANDYISCLRQEGHYTTAHVYKNALRSFAAFRGTEYVSSSLITRRNLRRYSSYLMSCRLKLNMISAYMRILHCIYNKGVDTHQAPYIHHLFRDVFTGVDIRQKKAIPINGLHTLLYKDPQSEKLRRTQAITNLLFLFCGMPFADLAHPEKSNLEGNVLEYNRIKTGAPVNIEISESASCIASRPRNTHSAILPEHPSYLFYILGGKNKRDEKMVYREYQPILRRFNNDLKSLAKKLCIHSFATSHTFRHSWVTTAKYRGVPIEMISESLGYKSIKTTQIYLEGFELNERAEISRLNYSYVRNYRGILWKVY